MKILVISTYPPNRIIYGSEMRSRRFIDFLKRKADLDLLTLSPINQESDQDYIKENFKVWFQLNTRHGKKPSLCERLTNSLTWQLLEYYDTDSQERFRSIIERGQYDLVFVNKTLAIFFCLKLPVVWRKKIVMDYDDIFSELYKNEGGFSLASWKNCLFLRLNEERGIRAFRAVLLCTLQAKLNFNKKLQSKIKVVPNVFDIRNRELLPAPQTHRLLFVGALDYGPNREGLVWFFDQIWPGFKEKYTDVDLKIIGKSRKLSPDSFYELFNHPKDVEINLNVPNVQPYYQDCFATIVPLLKGSGTRLKILESCALGRPVITTLKGVEGLELNDRSEVVVFRNRDEFINSFRDLLNKDLYDDVVSSARKRVEKLYSINSFNAIMEQEWHGLFKMISRSVYYG